MSVPPRPRQPWSACLLLALLVGGAVLATAWISDDALVTFRTVENLVAGEGFRWNVADRTQTATHPLWVLLLAAVRAVTGELYVSTIVVGVVLSAVGAALAARALPSGRWPWLALAVLLLGSRTQIEFGTCGLENPLSGALVAAFAWQWATVPAGPGRVRRLGVLAGLLALARQDLVLLVAPAVLAAAREVPWRLAVRALWPGALPVLAWYGFAWVYFGTVVPTPGYAKVLAADVPLLDFAAQGGWYLLDLLRRDPVTLAGLGAALIGACCWRRVGVVAPALGVALQILYTLRVGGDFMSGRFFSAAFVLAAVVAAGAGGRRWQGGLAGLALVLWWVPGLPIWAKGTPTVADYALWHGIGYERAWYAERLGLWSPQRFPIAHGMFAGMFAGRQRPLVQLHHAAGVPGYVNGRAVHVVDPFLCDPLLLRLPLEDAHRWRIGHFKRRLPEGWLETLAGGENRLQHPALARYWEALAVLLRAPVWSAERWRVWWGFQTGAYQPLLDAYVAEAYHRPPLVVMAAGALPAATPAGTSWADCRSVVVREGGLRITGVAGQGGTLRLLCDGGCQGELIVRRGDAELARLPLVVPGNQLAGLRWFEVPLPAAAASADTFEVRPVVDTASPDWPVTVLEVFAVAGVARAP